jgi:Tol biopolymer transport system component
VENSQFVNNLYSAPSGGGAAVKLNASNSFGVQRGILGLGLNYYYVSSDGSQVYYATGSSGKEGFYATPSAGGDSVSLTGPLPAGEVLRSFALSSDGKHLVYDTGQNGGIGQVYSINTTSGTQTVIESGASVGLYGFNFISADGNHVFTRRWTAGGTLAVLDSVPIDGGPSVQLFGPGVLNAAAPSPDGKLLWYAAAPNYDAAVEYYSVPVDGGDSVQLSNWGTREVYPEVRGQFNADGSRIVYVADQESAGKYDYFSVPSTGGTPVKLNGQHSVSRYDNPNLSPDGASALFRSPRGSADEVDLYVVPIEGGTPRQVNDPLDVLGSQVDPFFVTRDGRRIIYRARHDGSASNDIFSAPLEGGPSVKLNGPLVAGGDAWIWSESPDGERLIYVADQDVDEFKELFVVPTRGGTPVKLFPARQSALVSYSADGNRIAMTSQGELYTRVVRQRWAGGTGNWDVPANWNYSEAPDEVMQIVIEGPARVVATSSTTPRTVNELHVGGGAGSSALTIETGAILSALNGMVIESNGALDGNGSFTGDLTNSGAISPGASPGVLSINGSFSQTAHGVLDIDIAGSASFDKLQVAGQAELGGKLIVSLSTFLPSPGDEFPIIRAPGGVSGRFASLQFPSLPGGLHLNVIYRATDVALTVSAVPEPRSVTIVAFATIALSWQLRETARQDSFRRRSKILP